MTDPVRVFIGYDRAEPAAFHVLSHSIHRRAGRPVTIAPVMLSQTAGVFRRAADPLQSTDFSFSRFLVPYLCGFQGWAVFMDCDMLMLDDIAALWDLRDDAYTLLCVHHDHRPEETVKFLGAPQTRYERKNWSSVMLMNCAACAALTPDYVNTASGLELHRFRWIEDDRRIGALPARWNHLVDYDPPLPADKISNLHFTEGGPWFEDYAACGYADLWFAERDLMLRCGKDLRT